MSPFLWINVNFSARDPNFEAYSLFFFMFDPICTWMDRMHANVSKRIMQAANITLACFMSKSNVTVQRFHVWTTMINMNVRQENGCYIWIYPKYKAREKIRKKMSCNLVYQRWSNGHRTAKASHAIMDISSQTFLWVNTCATTKLGSKSDERQREQENDSKQCTHLF